MSLSDRYDTLWIRGTDAEELFDCLKLITLDHLNPMKCLIQEVFSVHLLEHPATLIDHFLGPGKHCHTLELEIFLGPEHFLVYLPDIDCKNDQTLVSLCRQSGLDEAKERLYPSGIMTVSQVGLVQSF